MLGLYSGAYTPTEAGAAGALFAILLSLLRRRLTWKGFMAISAYVARTSAQDMVRVATGMVLALMLLGSLWVGGEFFAGFVGIMAVLGLGEFYGSLRRCGYQPLALFGFLGAAGILAGTWFYGPVAIPIATVATVILLFFYYAFAPYRRDALTNGGLALLGMLWVTGSIAFAFPIAAAPDFRVLIVVVAATAATGRQEIPLDVPTVEPEAQHPTGARLVDLRHHGSLAQVTQTLGALRGEEMPLERLAPLDPSAGGQPQAFRCRTVGLHFVAHDSTLFPVRTVLSGSVRLFRPAWVPPQR